MVMSAEHGSKFAAHYRQWLRSHVSEKFPSGTINLKQTNKQTNNPQEKEATLNNPPFTLNVH